MPNEYDTKDLRGILAYTIKESVNEEDRSIRFVISSDKVDRHGERVEVSAIADAIKDFAKNPVCLACHRHSLDNGEPPVIGSWNVETFKAKTHTSEMVLTFATTPLAENYWTLYRDGHMKAVSIGFRILDCKEEVTAGKRVWIITKLELYEISCVAVGANREALARKGIHLPASEQSEIKGTYETLRESLKDLFQAYLAPIRQELEEIKILTLGQSDEFSEEMLNSDDSELSAAAPDNNERLSSIEKTLGQIQQQLNGA